MAEIILYQPDIPQNVGNIGRTCHVTGTKLTLIRPLGFSLAERHLKRAGMDYWKEINPNILDESELDPYLLSQNKPFYFLSSKAGQNYTDVAYSEDAILIFGKETSGLPDAYWQKWAPRFIKIPMRPGVRCLNLATSVGIALYELLRQHNFSL